jgi:signal transduction histidine kinase
VTTSFESGDVLLGPDPPLARLVEAWPEAGLLVGRDGVVLAASDPAARLLRTPPDARSRLRGRSLAELLGGRHAAALLEAVGGPGDPPAERLLREDGAPDTEPVLLARAHALDDRRVLVSLADASGETRLRSHLDRAERLASVGELLSSVAHELNNPLTTVLGYAEILLGEDTPGTPREELTRIREAALRCRRIVGNLLNLARAEAPAFEPVAVQQIVEHVVEFRGYAAGAAGILLETESDPSCPPVLGDFHRLVQAVLNLVTNAEDAVRSREEPRRVLVRTRALRGASGEATGAAVEVEDNGPGVPAALRAHVFQPFFTTKPRGRGTGLGLSLVRGTALAHGGEVRVEDSALGGARFVLELPAAR